MVDGMLINIVRDSALIYGLWYFFDPVIKITSNMKMWQIWYFSLFFIAESIQSDG
jgi:hypothetical protein